MNTPPRPQERGFSALEVVPVLIIITALAAAGYFILGANRHTFAPAEKTTAEKPAVHTAAGPVRDEAVVDAVKRYAEEQEAPGYEATLEIGGIGPEGKKALYSPEGDFALVNAGYRKPGEDVGGGARYLVKKEDQEWRVIFTGSSGDFPPHIVEKYQVPPVSEFK